MNPEYFTDLSKDYTSVSTYEDGSLNIEKRSQYLEHILEFEKKAFEQITPTLISQGYKVERSDRGSVGDLVAIKGKEIWHIDFLYVRDVSKYPTGMGMGRQQLLLRFGRLAVYNKPITKYSIVLDLRLLAKQLIQYKAVHLDIKTSVIILKESGYDELDFN